MSSKVEVAKDRCIETRPSKNGNQTRTTVIANAIFEEELAKRGLVGERDGEDRYRIQVGDLSLKVNIENVRRNAERDGDPDVIRQFVAQVIHIGTAPKLDWKDASPLLLLSAEPSDYEFGDTIQSSVTDEVSRVLTLTNREQSRVSWVTKAMCSEWDVQPDAAIEAALRNQDALLSGLHMQIEQVDGHNLGMVPLGSPFKASVIFAPSFQSLVEADLGWPVWVVIPCRDFIYVIEEQSQLVSRLGETVVREFRKSGYPITTEVLRISSDGIEAVGKFPR